MKLNNYILINKDLSFKLGFMPAATLSILVQLYYEAKVANSITEQNDFIVTTDKLNLLLNLSYYEQTKILKILIDNNYIEITQRGIPMVRHIKLLDATYQLKLNYQSIEGIQSLTGPFLDAKIDQEKLAKSAANKAKQKACNYFGIKNKSGLVMHHKNPDWKKSNIERYNQWNIDDLIVMTKSEHIKWHAKYNKLLKAGQISTYLELPISDATI